MVIDSATPSKFTLTLNRKRTRATLVVIYKLIGSMGSRPGKATFRLHVAGPWSAA